MMLNSHLFLHECPPIHVQSGGALMVDLREATTALQVLERFCVTLDIGMVC